MPSVQSDDGLFFDKNIGLVKYVGLVPIELDLGLALETALKLSFDTLLWLISLRVTLFGLVSLRLTFFSFSLPFVLL